mgnify:CR=1 FL=1
MIEVCYYYHRNDGKIIEYTNYFNKADKALRFIYKCIKSPKMTFISYDCEDPYDQEYIERRLK